MTTLNEYTTDLSNWLPLPEVHKVHPQFTYSQLKTLFWKRDEKAGLSRCCRIVGRRMYVCLPVFGLWLAGEVPEKLSDK